LAKRAKNRLHQKRKENIKWILMLTITIITLVVYLYSFIEIDKAHSNLVFKKKTLTQLEDNLNKEIASLELLKRSDNISKRAQKIGMIHSKPEKIIIKIND